MKKILLLLCLPLFAAAQKKDTIIHYFDESFAHTAKKNAVYYGVSVKEADHWYLYAVYSDNSPVLTAYYKDRQLKEKDGPYNMYFPGKKPAVACTYRSNRKAGIWRSWYENGQLKDSCFISDDQIVGEYKQWYANGQPRVICNYVKSSDVPQTFATATNDVGNANLRDGLYQSWYNTGRKESVGKFRNNQMDSTWLWYRENGEQSTIEHYSDGKLASMSCFDATGKEAGDFCSIAKPATVKGIGDYRQYIRDSLLWPDEVVKKNIEGIVKVKLTVSKQGKVTQLEIKSAEPVLKKTIEELFMGFREWYPAISHNRVVEWNDEFEIPFYQNR